MTQQNKKQRWEKRFDKEVVTRTKMLIDLPTESTHYDLCSKEDVKSFITRLLAEQDRELVDYIDCIIEDAEIIVALESFEITKNNIRNNIIAPLQSLLSTLSASDGEIIKME